MSEQRCVWITGARGMVGRALSDSLLRVRPDVRLLAPSSQELDLRNREAVKP